MSRTQTAAYPWGDYDVEPEDDYQPEPEDYCRARSGLCHPDGTCDKCGAIEGEHCRAQTTDESSPLSTNEPKP